MTESNEAGVSEGFKCGFSAIVGRPNVGKSTLMNRILGQKISITSRKPQTTRHQILGIKTTEAYQAIFVDTPGLHRPVDKAMNRYLNQAASSSIQDVDAVLFVVAGTKWTDEDQLVLERCQAIKSPIILVVNQIDRLEKAALMSHIEVLAEKMAFHAIVPVSAKTGKNVDTLEEQVAALLPVSKPHFPEDQITNRSMRFIAAEIVREKLTRQLGQELPYEMTVEIETYEIKDEVVHIGGDVHILIDGQVEL